MIQANHGALDQPAQKILWQHAQYLRDRDGRPMIPHYLQTSDKHSSGTTNVLQGQTSDEALYQKMSDTFLEECFVYLSVCTSAP